MTKKNKKQTRFEIGLMSLGTWVKMLKDNEEEEFNEPEQLKFDLHVLYYKLKELINSYGEIRRRTLSPVAECIWKDIKNDLNNLYKEQEE